jgi:hypothetical protein
MPVRHSPGAWTLTLRASAVLSTLLLGHLAAAHADSLYIADGPLNTIYTYDTATQQTQTFAGPGSGLSDPTAMAYDGVHNQLYVTNANGTVYRYDANTGQGTQVATLNSGTPVALAYDAGHDRLYIAADGGPTTVYRYDVAGGQLTNVESSNTVSDPTALAYDYTHDRLYIANGQGPTTVYQYDAGPQQTTPVENGGTVASPDALAYDATHDRLYIGNQGAVTVYQYDAGPQQTTPIIDSSTIGHPTSVAYDAGNDSLYVGNEGGVTTVYQYDDFTKLVKGVENNQSVPLASADAIRPVPEPASMALLGVGGFGLLSCLRLRRKSHTDL